MTEEEKDIKGLAEDLAGRMEKHNEQIKMNAESSEEVKGEIKKITEKLEENGGLAEKQQEQLDDIQLNLKGLSQDKKEESKTFVSELKGMFESDNYENLKATGNRLHYGMEVKAGDMTTANTYTGDVIEPQRVRSFVFDPDNPRHIRQVLTSGVTNSDKVSFPQETAFDNGTATRAEGATMGQSDFDLELKEFNVRHISAFVVASREMLEDTAGLESYIRTRLLDKYMLKEDDQLLNGNGTAPNLSGLITNATAYSDQLADSSVNKYDVLFNAGTQVFNNNLQASWHVVHPTDYMKLSLTKDDDGMYIYPAQVRTGGAIQVDGVPVFRTTAIANGRFLTLDQAAAQIFDRRNVNIEMWMQDSTNARNRKVTITINGSLALPIYHTGGLVTATFASAEAEGTA